MTENLSPDPILGACDDYRGSILDLDRSCLVGPAELAAARHRLAQQLRHQNLTPGDRVVLAVGNGPRFVCALAAVLLAGGAPLLVHADTPPAELRRTALRWGARFLLADACDEAAFETVTVRTQSLAGDSWERILWGAVDIHDPGFQAHQLSLPGVPLHPTSGTTGQPKVAVRPGACAIAEALHYVQTIGIEAGDRILAVPPMSHAYAYGLCVMAALVSGATVVSMRRFSPKLVARALREQRITILPLVPAMLDLLLLGSAGVWSDVPRCTLSAGAPLSERTALEFRRATGRMVRPLYGTTETGGIAVAKPDDQPAVTGCVGPPMQGVSARVEMPAEQGSLPPGVGRLSIRSPSMMAGYLGPGRIDASVLVDGWFETGDLAQLDEAGAIHLKGRETEVINVFGMKVIPTEVEEALALLPDVVEAKVYAGRHASGSQIVKAAIVASVRLDTSAVRAHCERHLAPFKRPEVITLVERLPRSPSGKIVRDQLP